MTTAVLTPPRSGDQPTQAEAGRPPHEIVPPRGNPPLHMIQAEIDPMAFARWMRESDTDDPDTAAHHLLVESFGPRYAPRPFRVINHRSHPPEMLLLGYAPADAETLRTIAMACQDPLQARALDPGTIESKPMPQVWSAGFRYSFELRARPITRTRKDPMRAPEPARSMLLAGLARPGAEYDVHRWETLRARHQGQIPRSPEEIYAQWLSRMFARSGAASLAGGRIKLVAMRSNPARRHRGGHAVPGMDVIMTGRLIIEKPEEFNALLRRGIGRHIAYGHGMLLLKPPA